MQRWQADTGLLLLTVIWGMTFTIVHDSVQTYPPVGFIALRFAVASLAFSPVLYRHRRDLRGNLVPGLVLGLILFLGFATQTMGLAHTTPARAAFITGLSVVLVPIIGRALGHRLAPRTLAGVALAVVGLVIVTQGCRWPWFDCVVAEAAPAGQALGDTLVLLCAVAFAFHIVAVGHWSKTRSAVTLNGVQMLVVCLAATLTSMVVDGPVAPSRATWTAAVFLGIVATALVLTAWLTWQRYTTATHAALIFTLEPVFAAFFSWLWTGERLTRAIWGGGALMLLGVIIAELPARAPRVEPDDLELLAEDPAAR